MEDKDSVQSDAGRTTASENKGGPASLRTVALNTFSETVTDSMLEVNSSLNEGAGSMESTTTKLTTGDKKISENPNTNLDNLDMQKAKQLMDLCLLNLKETWPEAKNEDLAGNIPKIKMDVRDSVGPVGFDPIIGGAHGGLKLPSAPPRPLLPPVKVIRQTQHNALAVNVGQDQGSNVSEPIGAYNDIRADIVRAGGLVNAISKNVHFCDNPEKVTSDINRSKDKMQTDKEVDKEFKGSAASPNSSVTFKQFRTKLKHNNDNFQNKTFGVLPLTHKLVTKREKRGQISNLPGDFVNFDSEENMEEIDLKEDRLDSSLGKIEHENDAKNHAERSKYNEIKSNCSSAIGFLRAKVVKVAIIQGAKLKEVVNESINTLKQHEDNTQADVIRSKQSVSNYSSVTTTGTHSGNEASQSFPSDNNQMYSPGFGPNSVLGSYNNTTAYNTQPITSSPKSNTPNFMLTGRPASTSQSYNIKPDRISYKRPAPTAPILTSSVRQSPGPVRGYTTLTQPPYAPPPLPPPPTTSAGNYFATRSFSTRYSSPAPTYLAQPYTQTDRQYVNPTASSGSKLVGNMASLINMKSNRMKDDFTRRLSSSVEPAPASSPLAGLFMESDHVRRSSMDSGSDRFYDDRYRGITFDDMLKNTLCCCCWPLGLSARLITLMMPESNRPVDNFIKSMSNQLTSLALLMGIATYLVVFLLWFSILFVSASHR